MYVCASKDEIQVEAVECEVPEVGRVIRSTTTTTTTSSAGFHRDRLRLTATYHHQLEVFRHQPTVYRVNCGQRLTENGE